jgi:hypothetical protein
MATEIKTKLGQSITLLNPSEKASRFAEQIRTGVVKETGQSLGENTKDNANYAYRRGYLASRRDSADAYLAKGTEEERSKLKANKADRFAKRAEARAKRAQSRADELSKELSPSKSAEKSKDKSVGGGKVSRSRSRGDSGGLSSEGLFDKI